MKDDPYELGWLAADWPAPAHIHAGTTLRSGGVSKPPYDQLNLGTHVNDEQSCVLRVYPVTLPALRAREQHVF